MFICLGMTQKDQNCMHVEIKSRLNSGNSCYCLAKNNFSTHLQSSNMKIKIYINIILSVALHGCKTWSLTPRKGYRLRVFDNREEVTGDWRRMQNEELNYLCCSFYIMHMIKSRRMSLVEHEAHIEEKCVQDFGGGYLKKGDYLKYLHIDVTMHYNCLIFSEMPSIQLFIFFYGQRTQLAHVILHACSQGIYIM